jgi:hypothetical protein
MSIEVEQSATGFVNFGTSFDIVFGSAPAAGNFLLFIGSIAQLTIPRTPSISGFTNVHSRVNGTAGLFVLTKTAGSSESATYSVSISGWSEYHSGIMLELSGVDTSDPFDGISSIDSLTSPSLIPSVVGVLPISALVLDNAPDLSAPSGWSNLVSVRPDHHGAYLARRDLGTDTSTSYSAAWGSGDVPVSITILVAPAASGSLSMPSRHRNIRHLIGR